MFLTVRIRIRFILFLWFSTVLGTVAAHPHSWIQLTTDFVIDEDETLVEIRQRWIFDEFYSALSLADIDKQFSSDRNLGLKLFGDNVISNLTNYNFFSKLVVNQQAVSIPVPEKYAFSAIEVKENVDVLVLEMIHVFPEPIAVDQHPVEWQVYDPTYYVSMMHNELPYVRLVNASSLECEPELTLPDPAQDTIEFARSLDITQTETDGLGKYFAETITLECY